MKKIEKCICPNCKTVKAFGKLVFGHLPTIVASQAAKLSKHPLRLLSLSFDRGVK